jgi:hypothetical protein
MGHPVSRPRRAAPPTGRQPPQPGPHSTAASPSAHLAARAPCR